MWISANRTSSILYNYLISLGKDIKFYIPANICPIVLATFHKADMSYELVDINEMTLCLDFELLQKQLKPEVDSFGVLFVRTFGNYFDVGTWFSSIKSKYPNSHIIDDRCLCKPELNQGKLNNDVDITLFSTGYAKFVEFGYGGFAWLNTILSSEYKHEIFEYNKFDHDEIVNQFNQAITSQTRFHYENTNWLDFGRLEGSTDQYFNQIESQLEIVTTHKSALNAIYESIIPKEIWLGSQYSDWRFSILVNNKAEVLKAIFDAGLFASSHYASMAGIFDDKSAPVANRIHSKIVNLFNDYRFTKEQAERVAKIVKSVGDNNG